MTHLETAVAMIAAYNAQDADLYVSYMTDDACEAGYRGAVVREGKEGTRTGLAASFAKAGYVGKVLVIDGDAVNENFALAANNIVGVNVLPAIGANVYDILKHDTLVLNRAAFEKLEARFNG